MEVRLADHLDFHKPGAWVAVDLDGTLAEHYGSKGWQGYDHIGPPVPAMLQAVKDFLEDGIEVRIFTARAAMHNTLIDAEGNQLPIEALEDHRTKHPVSYIDAVGPIEKWCEEHIGQRLTVTCKKDPGCVLILDDRAMQVIQNTGEVVVAQYDEVAEITSGAIQELKAKLEMLPPEHRK
jgi:hypothetical protein